MSEIRVVARVHCDGGCDGWYSSVFQVETNDDWVAIFRNETDAQRWADLQRGS